MRRRLGSSIVTMLAVLVFAGGAQAGGWARVTVTGLPADPAAGEVTAIELDVLQHGQTPVSWPTLTVVATDGSGAVVRAGATPHGPVGSYVATIVFPAAGAWRLSFESTDLIMEGTAAVDVMPAIASASAVGRPSPVELPAVGLVAALAIAAGLAAAVALRERRRAPGDAPAAAKG